MGAAISAAPQKILLILCTAACASAIWDNAICNKTQLYQTDSQVCCNNQIHAKRDDAGNLRDCCKLNEGQMELYNKTTHICCEKRLFERKPSKKLECKYEKIYEMDKDLVCPGTPEPKLYRLVPDLSQVGCCGSQMYTKTEKGCCKGEDPAESNLLPHPLANDEDCCGRLPYNRTKVCLNDELYPSNMAFCLTTLYNKETQVCCRQTGTTLTRPPAGDDRLTVYPEWGCCNETLINKKISHCLSDQRIIPKGCKSCGNSYFCPEIRLGVQERCCDHVVRNASSDIPVECCGNKLIQIGVDVCCNNMPIDTETQTCCQDTIRPKVPGIECCNEMDQYNVTEKVCCHHGVINKTNLSDTNCCGNTSYNNNTMTCKGSKLEIIESPKPIKQARNSASKRCPYCGKRRKAILPNILGKEEYRFRIDEITRKKRNWILRATILQPRMLKKKIRLAVPFCRCFTKGKLYLLYTSSPVIPGKLLKISEEKKDVLILKSRKNIALLKQIGNS